MDKINMASHIVNIKAKIHIAFNSRHFSHILDTH